MVISEQERRLLDADALRLLAMLERGRHALLLTEVDELSKRGAPGAALLGLAAISLAELERYDEAGKAAQAALDLQPGWAWLHGAAALVEARQKRWAPAVESQFRAVRLLPGDPGGLAVLAGYQREAGRPDEAARTARQALMLDPGHAGALNQLGLALWRAGDVAGACVQFREAQASAPADPAGYVNEGVLHLRAGARGEARRAFLAALQRRKGYAEAENLLVETYVSARPLQAAARHALDLSRLRIVGWLLVAFFYYLLFRLVEFIWKVWPPALPAGQALLVLTLVWLLGGAALGLSLRLGFSYRAAIQERSASSPTSKARKA